MADQRVTDVIREAVKALEAVLKALEEVFIQPPKLLRPPMLLLGAGKPTPGTDTPEPTFYLLDEAGDNILTDETGSNQLTEEE